MQAWCRRALMMREAARIVACGPMTELENNLSEVRGMPSDAGYLHDCAARMHACSCHVAAADTVSIARYAGAQQVPSRCPAGAQQVPSRCLARA
jgi:hypothetical protein